MRTAIVLAALGGVALLVGATVAVAQSTDEATMNLDPGYPGVIPGTGHAPPASARAAREPRAVVTWPGFQLTEGGSRVFVQSTRRIEWTRADTDGRVVVVVRNARIHLSNSYRPLITEHFSATPVRQAELERRGRDVHLVIEVKVATVAGVSTHDAGDGYYYLYVDFPAGEYHTPDSSLPRAVEAPASTAIDLGGGLAIRRGRTRDGAAAEEAAPAASGGDGATDAAPGTTTTTVTTTTTTTTESVVGGAAETSAAPAPVVAPGPLPAPTPTPLAPLPAPTPAPLPAPTQ
ncbi:MAG: hypothetical protein JXB32_02395 [Deltaproteobacteria bacterium]|nr:hypothetical protein [Deltaproteobacteria bacterium]